MKTFTSIAQAAHDWNLLIGANHEGSPGAAYAQGVGLPAYASTSIDSHQGRVVNAAHAVFLRTLADALEGKLA